MGVTTASLRHMVDRSAAAARDAEAELNAADAKLGDGDTGFTVRRLCEALAAAKLEDKGDLGMAFAELARISASTTGSSLGTLMTVAMMVLSKSTRGRDELRWAELSTVLSEVRDRVLARGGATLGDKTVVDMLDAVIVAGEGKDDAQSFASAANAAASETLDRFRGLPNRIGRARMFAERSVGMDDPGMLAFARLLRALSGG